MTTDDRTGPAGDQPEPGQWPEPDWDSNAEMDALRRQSDAYRVNAMAHYIREGHPYTLALRNGNSVPWIDPTSQFVLFVRLDDCNELMRIEDRLKRQREGRTY